MPDIVLVTEQEQVAGGLRGRGAEPASAPATALGDLPSEQNYLDIPAFLRRQAD
jgi:cell division protein FtsZ